MGKSSPNLVTLAGSKKDGFAWTLWPDVDDSRNNWIRRHRLRPALLSGKVARWYIYLQTKNSNLGNFGVPYN
jgi:cAMP phosphodiesterase